MKAFQDSFHNLGTLLLRYPISFVSTIFIARMLGPDLKGLYSFSVVIVGVSIAIMSMGMGNAIQYYLSNREYNVSRVVVTNLSIGFTIGFLVTIIMVILWSKGLLGTTGNLLPAHIFYTLLLSIPFEGLLYSLRFTMIGVSDFKQNNIVSLSTVFMNSTVVLVLIFALEDRLYGAVLGSVISKMLVCIVALYFAFLEYRPKLLFDWEYLKSIYKYGLKSWIGSISSSANDQLDQFMLGWFANPAALGLYSVSFSLVRLILLPSNSVSSVFFNLISSSNSQEHTWEVFRRVHAILFVLTLSFSLILMVGVYYLVPIVFGQDYINSITPFFVLIPGMLFFAVTRRLIQKYLAATGLPLKTSMIQASGALFGLVMYLLLIPTYGAIGAAMGTTLAYLTSTIVSIYFLRKAGSNNKLFSIYATDFKWFLYRVRNTYRSRNKSI